MISVFPQQIKLETTVQSILRQHSSVKIGFNMPHTSFSIHHVTSNLLSFNNGFIKS